MTNRFTAPMLLLLAGVCVLAARTTAADGQEKTQGATRPAISQEVAPLEAIVPVAKDGHKGEAYVRKPPGKGLFPAVVLVHGDIVRWPTTQLKEYALGTWSYRYLAAGYVVAVTTYRSRDLDPQTRESPDDVLATVEYVRKLSYVDPKSVAVNGTSGGGDLALTVAAETDVAVIVVEEPAGPVTMGVFNKNTPKRGERFTPFDGSRFQEDPKKFYTPEFQKPAREKLARIRCPIVLLKGDVDPGQLQQRDFDPGVAGPRQEPGDPYVPERAPLLRLLQHPGSHAATGGRRECVRGCQRPDAAASAHEAVAHRPELDQAGAV